MIMRNMYGLNDVMMTFSGTQNFAQNFVSPQVTFNLPSTAGMFGSGRGNAQATPGYGFVGNTSAQSIHRQRCDFPSMGAGVRSYPNSSLGDSGTIQPSFSSVYPPQQDRSRDYAMHGSTERPGFGNRYENLQAVYPGTTNDGHAYRTPTDEGNVFSPKVENRSVFSPLPDDRNLYHSRPGMTNFENSGRAYFPSSIEKFKGYDQSKVPKWNQKDSYMEIDRETESYLAQVNEDQLELEQIAATLKEDCQSPSSLELFLQNDIFASTVPTSIASKGACAQAVNDRPQYLDLGSGNARVSSSQYQGEDYSLSLGLKALQSPGMYRNFGNDTFSNPASCVQGVPQIRSLSESTSGNYPYLHSDTSGEMTFSRSLPAFSDTLDLDVFFEEQNERKETIPYMDSNWRTGSSRRNNPAHATCSPKSGRRRSVASTKSDCKLQGDSLRGAGSRTKLKVDKGRSLKLPLFDVDRTDKDKSGQSRIGDSPKENIEPNNSEHVIEEPKRDGRRRRYYFENEEHYEVCKLLRELSAVRTPTEVPPTTAASLFYRQLTNDTEPRVMKTVQPVPNEKGRKVVVRKDIPEEKIGKYSKVGNSPFVYMHGSPSPDGARSASLKLVELLTTKGCDELKKTSPADGGDIDAHNTSDAKEEDEVISDT